MMSPTDPLTGRFSPQAPLVLTAQGAWLYTKAGRQADYLLGNCCNILGHAHPQIVARVREQVAQGTNWGDNRSPLAIKLARRVADIARMSSIRLVSSGSEAVHLALRTARAATGRRLVLKFEGHFHGWFTEELSRFVPMLEYANGISATAGAEILVVPWNDLEALNRVLEDRGEEIAAIICEPVLCHAGTIPPADGFLSELRNKCDQIGALLIFDECITGFRLALGGAQEKFGVRADIVTYSKAISAGVPMGAVAGTAAAMEPLRSGAAHQAATYDANALSVAAANAVLDVLELGEPYRAIENAGRSLQTGMSEVLSKHSIPHVVQGFPAVFQIFFTESDHVANHAEAMRTDIAFHSALVAELRSLGVNVYAGDLRTHPEASWLSQWFVSAAHNEEVVDFTLQKYAEAVQRVAARNGPASSQRSRVSTVR